jgi:hypothetical protein
MNVVKQLVDLGYLVQLEGDEVVCRWNGPGHPVLHQVLPLFEELKRMKPQVVESLQPELPESVDSWASAWRRALQRRTKIMVAGKITVPEARERAEVLVRESYRSKIRRWGA